MANSQIIDELIVKLTLKTDEYKKKDKERQNLVDTTEQKERKQDKERDKRSKKRAKDARDEKREDGERRKRLQGTEGALKSLGATMSRFAVGAAAVFGIGVGVSGISSWIAGLINFENSMTRAGVATGMSNRQMQAWGATAKRMGADAEGGADAIAALAKEQKQFNIQGPGPIMQALARAGIRVGPDTKPEDALAMAQQRYREGSPAQRQQMESLLALQGVSSDLIVMIKSETDAREAYARSFADSVEENKETMGAFNDAMTSLKQASLQLANVIAVAATPYIKEFSDWVHDLASDPHRLDAWLDKTATALSTLRDSAADLADGFKAAWDVVKNIAHPVAAAGRSVGNFLAKDAKDFQAEDPTNQYHGTPPGLYLRRMLHSIGLGNNPDLNIGTDSSWLHADKNYAWGDITGTTTASAAASPSASGAVSSQDFMQMLIQRGMTPAQAMAATVNAGRETTGSANMINPSARNSIGASGAFQWLGPRKAAFRSRYGVDPDQSSLNNQLDFLFSNPAELGLMQRAFAGGGDAGALGKRWSQVFEAHGNMAEDVKRGQLAAQMARTADASTSTTTNTGTSINLNGPVTVKADNPEEFIGGIQRVARVQSYNGAVR